MGLPLHRHFLWLTYARRLLSLRRASHWGALHGRSLVALQAFQQQSTQTSEALWERMVRHVAELAQAGQVQPTPSCPSPLLDPRSLSLAPIVQPLARFL